MERHFPQLLEHSCIAAAYEVAAEPSDQRKAAGSTAAGIVLPGRGFFLSLSLRATPGDASFHEEKH
jgi:hypothetical protein